MEKDGRYFIVGLFVSAALAALFCFTVWLAGPHEKKNYVFYTVEFTDPVSGLAQGSAVEYKGVRVGEVLKLRLVPECFNLVRVDIGVSRQAPVRAHTRVSLKSQGLTGGTSIEMETDDADNEKPPTVRGEPYPVLEGHGSDLYRILADVAAVAASAKNIAEKLDGAIDGALLESLRNTVLNAERVSRGLDDMFSPMNVASASTLVANLAQASEKAPATMDRLHNAAGAAQKAAQGVSSVVSRNRASIDRFAGSGLSDAAGAMHEAKGAAASVRGLSDKLKDNPSQLIYQPSDHGVEIPK
jgi:phospholipid/cholesterol/gamma-HCH transport system substrate-binding protein